MAPPLLRATARLLPNGSTIIGVMFLAASGPYQTTLEPVRKWFTESQTAAIGGSTHSSLSPISTPSRRPGSTRRTLAIGASASRPIDGNADPESGTPWIAISLDIHGFWRK